MNASVLRHELLRKVLTHHALPYIWTPHECLQMSRLLFWGRFQALHRGLKIVEGSYYIPSAEGPSNLTLLG